MLESSSLTEFQVKIDCDLERKQGKTVWSWLAGNLKTRASLSFHWQVKIEGDTSTCLQYKEKGKCYRKNTSTGSIRFNWAQHNSSLCSGKNSLFFALVLLTANQQDLCYIFFHRKSGHQVILRAFSKLPLFLQISMNKSTSACTQFSLWITC